jgi:hypothetical protein
MGHVAGLSTIAPQTEGLPELGGNLFGMNNDFSVSVMGPPQKQSDTSANAGPPIDALFAGPFPHPTQPTIFWHGLFGDTSAAPLESLRAMEMPLAFTNNNTFNSEGISFCHSCPSLLDGGPFTLTPTNTIHLPQERNLIGDHITSNLAMPTGNTEFRTADFENQLILHSKMSPSQKGVATQAEELSLNIIQCLPDSEGTILEKTNDKMQGYDVRKYQY